MFEDKCQISTAFAYMMFAYLIGSVYYFVHTRFIGTPFRDSLTQEQIAIKEESANNRRIIFYTGLVGAAIILYVTKYDNYKDYKWIFLS